uniref:Uncharacterized protein n=1 Tax=Triticum urartu TaxID=4572 RepID=A0A8R7UVM3_TRIUA
MNAARRPDGVGDFRWLYDQLGFWRTDLGRRRLRRRQIGVADPCPAGGLGLGWRQCWQHLAMSGRLLCRRVEKLHLGELQVQAPQRIRAFDPFEQPQVQDPPHAAAHPPPSDDHLRPHIIGDWDERRGAPSLCDAPAAAPLHAA